MKKIGKRIVLRGYTEIMVPVVAEMLRQVSAPVPGSFLNGIVVYVGDNGKLSTLFNPGTASQNPEWDTVDITDGNLTAFANAVVSASREVEKYKPISFDIKGSTVIIRKDGSVTYGCTTLSSEEVDQIINARKAHIS